MTRLNSGLTVSESVNAEAPPFHTIRLRKFTVEQFQKIIESGVLGADPRIELIEGWITDKMTVNPPHAVAIELVQETLAPLLPPRWRLRVQLPITTADSQPEPDFAVVRGPARSRKSGHPQPDSIGMLIEVSDTTLDDDRHEMGRIYARAGIAIYWIINLRDGMIEVYTRPRGGKSPAYSRREVFQRADKVPLILEDDLIAEIVVADLLP